MTAGGSSVGVVNRALLTSRTVSQRLTMDSAIFEQMDWLHDCVLTKISYQTSINLNSALA